MTKQISGTKEWATSNENIMFGCQHDCLYGYCKAMSVRHKKIDINRWHDPIIREDQLMKGIGKRKGTIMFPSTHDIHPDNLSDVMFFLNKLLRPGNKVLIVSKPHLKCIQRICESFGHYKDQILFRFTIGSTNDEILKFWEPGAPLFYERIRSLIHAWFHGFKTSVSCEPMLSEYIDLVIDEVKPYVTDSIWLGKMNDYHRRLKINKAPEVPKELMDNITHWEQTENVMGLYIEYKDDPMIKWKESLKKVIGLEMPVEKGMDV